MIHWGFFLSQENYSKSTQVPKRSFSLKLLAVRGRPSRLQRYARRGGTCYGAVDPLFPSGSEEAQWRTGKTLTRPTFHEYHSNFGSGSARMFRVPLIKCDIHTPCKGSIKKIRVVVASRWSLWCPLPPRLICPVSSWCMTLPSHSFHSSLVQLITSLVAGWKSGYPVLLLAGVYSIYQIDNFLRWMMMCCLLFQTVVPQGSVLNPICFLFISYSWAVNSTF